MKTDILGELYKEREEGYRNYIPLNMYIGIRVDIRAGHTYLRGADKPFDLQFAEDMQTVSRFLCKEVPGTLVAYTQSDEISLLLDPVHHQTETWFGGEVSKIVSTTAALASVKLNDLRPGRLVTFDSRVWDMYPDEVPGYFRWRQVDAWRNAISMAAGSEFSHRELLGKSIAQRVQMLKDSGVEISDYPEYLLRGSLARPTTREKEISYVHKGTGETHTTVAVRKVWKSSAAPPFWFGQDLESFLEAVS